MITHATSRAYRHGPKSLLCGQAEQGSDLIVCIDDTWERVPEVNCPECRFELDKIAAKRERAPLSTARSEARTKFFQKLNQR